MINKRALLALTRFVEPCDFITDLQKKAEEFPRNKKRMQYCHGTLALHVNWLHRARRVAVSCLSAVEKYVVKSWKTRERIPAACLLRAKISTLDAAKCLTIARY